MSNYSRLPDVDTLESTKHHIQHKLKLADKKIMKLEQILQQKTAKRGGMPTLPPAEITRTVGGFVVSDFRMPVRSNKVIATERSINRHGEDAEPQVKGSKLEKIQLRHLQRTVCKREVNARLAEQERLAKIAESKKKAKITCRNVIPESMLPNRYIRGELPCTIEHGTKGHYLSWACPLENLDYEYYLQIFFDGLQCTENPVNFLARQGIEDMLYSAKGHSQRIIPCIKSLVRPLRNAFMKHDTEVLLGTLKALQQLILSGPGVAEAILPFSKQFMSPMALYLEDCKNIGDSMDYAQRRNNDVGEEVRKTLELLEENAGPNALKAIKFSVPTYQSCVQPTNFRKEMASLSQQNSMASAGGGTRAGMSTLSHESSFTK